MALPTQYRNPTQVKTGPGIILLAPEVTGAGSGSPLVSEIVLALRSNVAAGKFTYGFPGFYPVGYTDEGLTLTLGAESEDVEVAEEYYPLRKIQTKKTGQIEFAMSGINQFNLQAALNGGVWTVTGSGDTQVSVYSPPKPGEEVRHTLVHIGADGDEVLVAYKVLQTAELSMSRKKGAEKASLAGATFEMEVPAATVTAHVWNYVTAGTWADSPTVLA